jgi:hypothetical protein
LSLRVVVAAGFLAAVAALVGFVQEPDFLLPLARITL